MSPKSRTRHKKRQKKPLKSRPPREPVPELDDEEIEEIKAQADEAVKLLALVKDQLPKIIKEIPRGQLVEYLRHGNRRTYARYFKGFRTDRMPFNRLVGYLTEEIFRNNNGVLAHLLIVLWNDVKRDLYEATRKELQVIDPDVEKIEKVPADLSREILTRLIERYGKEDVAILSLINDARFDREVVEELLPEWDWPPLRHRELTEREQEMLAEMKAAEEEEQGADSEPDGGEPGQA